MERDVSQVRPPWHDRPLWRIRPVRDVLIAAAIGIIAVLIYRTRHILEPVFIGLLLAYVCHPLISLAERRLGLKRPISAALLLGIGYALLVGMGVWLAPVVVDQTGTLVERAPQYAEQLGLDPDVGTEGLIERTRAWIVASEERPLMLLQTLGGVLGATTRVLFWLFLPPVCFFFFAWWMPSMYARALHYMPRKHRDRIVAILERMDVAVGGFLRARLIVAVVVGVLFSGAFYLAGVPYWFLIGMITGFISIVPYISGLGWIVAMALKYFELSAAAGEVSWLAVLLWPSVAYWSVNMLEEWVILPWIQSREMNISALTVLIVVLIGGVLWGILGLILAVPVAACIKILAEEIVIPRVEAWARRS